jgi:dual specificity phosphatase 12
MSYLLHGSTAHTGMGWVDLVPRAGKLYIGGLYALYQTDLIEAAGITHILSVIDYDIDPLLRGRFKCKGLKHFHIRVEDHPNENLLQHFPSAVQFIDQALNSVNGNPRVLHEDDSKIGGEGEAGCRFSSQFSNAPATLPNESKVDKNDGGAGGVFIHCAMGKSRSATLVCAYLIYHYALSPSAALEQLCEGRPVCEPNVGFREQLEVWAEMCAVDRKEGGKEESKKEKRRVYKRWMSGRFVGEVWEWEKRVINKTRKDERDEEGMEEVMKAKL